MAEQSRVMLRRDVFFEVAALLGWAVAPRFGAVKEQRETNRG